MSQIQKTPPVSEKRVFLFILLVGLINGLVFIFLIPPWQHYDEPSQLEFAWLIANRARLPKSGEYDQEMRREVAASMIEHHFFDHLNFKPNLVSQTDPVWIGISQTGDRPIYYILVALPLYLLRTTDITLQLVVGRFVSLILYLVIILCGYGITGELTQPGSPLRWMVPLLLALIPSFTDSMTSINNDVGATAFFSLFLWSSILLVRRGISIPRLLALVVTAVLCFWTKNTVAFSVLLFPIVLIFSIFTGKKRSIAWITTAVIILGIIAATFSWGGAAYWFPRLFSEQKVRLANPQAPLGKYALALTFHPKQTASRLIQVVHPQSLAAVRAKKVTLGAWMWATAPIGATIPTLLYDSTSIRDGVNLTGMPQFVALSATIPENTSRLEIVLAPIGTSNLQEDITIYYDGVVLAVGDYPPAQPPQFDNPSARSGLWGGEPFTNLIVNSSAETAWPRVRVWADQLISKYTPIQPSTLLVAVLDWRVSANYYLGSLIHLLQTFWARFGWGNVVITGFHPYTFVGVVTALGLIGALIAGIQRLNPAHKFTLEIGFILAIVFIWIWGAALSRGVSSILGGDLFIPSARYAYPAIIPTLLLLSTGWLELIQITHRKTRIDCRILFGGFIAFLAVLDLYSVMSIARFYY